MMTMSIGEKPATIHPFDRIAALRRSAQKMLRGRALRLFRNDIVRLRKLNETIQARVHRGKTLSASQQQVLNEFSQKQRIADQIEQQWQRICACEDDVMSALYAKDGASQTVPVEELRQAWQQVLLGWYCLRFATPDRVTLALYSKHRDYLLQLGRAYYQILAHWNYGLTFFWLTQKPGLKTAFEHHREKQPDRFWAKPAQHAVWLIFDIKGPAVYPRYYAEQGIHQFVLEKKKTFDCLVHVGTESGETYLPPANLVQHGEIQNQTVQREYVIATQRIRDREFKKDWPWIQERLSDVLGNIIDNNLRQRIQEELLK
jgi:hypothetical protein